MATSLDILIRARDEASAVINRVGGSGKALGSTMQGVGDRMKSVGSTMTRTLTPAAAAAGFVFAQAGRQWDEAVRTLRAGNADAEFDKLLASAKKVGGQVTQPLNEVAKALDMVSDRTGATGGELETLTKKFLDLEHLTGEAASSTIPNVTRLFGDWSVKTADQSETMDKLFRASEVTGISIDSLAATMVQFGSPLRNLGVDMDTAAVMFARFEKEGVNTQTIMPGLKMALKNFAAAGKDPQKALLGIINKIKETSSVAEANTLAFKIFGARAGPDMAAAIREGRFELDDLRKAMVNGNATIADSVKKSGSLADTFGKLKNRVMMAIGPFGDVGAAILGGVAALGPMVMGIGALASVQGVATAATWLFNAALAAMPWLLIAAAIIALAVVIYKNWDKIKAFLLDTWESIKSALAAAWDWIVEFVKAVPGRLLAGLKRLPGMLLRLWLKAWWLLFKALSVVVPKILNFVFSIPGRIGRFLGRLPGILWRAGVAGMKALWNGLKVAVPAILRFMLQSGLFILRSLWEGLKIVLPAVLGFIGRLPGMLLRALGNLASLLWNAGKELLSGLWEGMKAKAVEIFTWTANLGSKIASLKGPLAKDRLLLVAQGAAIVDGLGRGMRSRFGGIESVTRDLTGMLTVGAEGAMESAGVSRARARARAGALSGAAGGRPARIDISIDRRRWVDASDFETAYRGF